ncbi:MAG TPA: CHAT domain-containing protein [Stenomitos sp.]
MARRQPVFRRVQFALKHILLGASLTLLILLGQGGVGLIPFLTNLPSLNTGVLPVLAQNPVINAGNPTVSDAPQLVEQGRKYYDQEQFSDAVTVWQQAASVLATQGNELQEARVLSYLSLALQQLGKWKEADEVIANSLKLLQTRQNIGNSKERTLIFAQALTTQGHLQLALGKAGEALKIWQQASNAYTRLGDDTGKIGSLINQAQAMQAAGLLREALQMLTQANISLQNQPDSLLKFTATRSLGDLLRVVGNPDNSDPSWQVLQKKLGLNNSDNLEQSKQILQKSLEMAQQLQSPQAMGAALLSLGDWARDSYNRERSLYERTRPSLPDIKPALRKVEKALVYYQGSIAEYKFKPTRIKAQLNQLTLLLETEQWLLKIEKWSDAENLWITQIKSQVTNWSETQYQIANLPPGLTAINAQINFAKSHIRLKQVQEKVTQYSSYLPQISNQPLWSEVDQLINKAIQRTENFVKQAINLEDKRTEAYVLGIVGQLYEQIKDLPNLSKAQKITDKAIQISQSIQAWDIAYQWQWQLGRIRKAQGKIEGKAGAIEAYNAAVNTLQTIRQDLAALNPDIQFSFRDDVEPVYRELVDLLLQSENPSQPNLNRAREVMASLQLAELENFLKEVCSPATPALLDRVVDQYDPTAAVIYPIILENRLEVILKLPQKTVLQHSVNEIAQNELERTVDELRKKILERETSDKSIQEIKKLSQPIYNLVIKPFEEQLKATGVKTLVFVLDGALQNIPMAVISDGNKYLIEDYAIALNREPQLLEPLPLSKKQLPTLAFGLSKVRRDFSPHTGFLPLENVQRELEQIPSEVKLLNEKFTSTALQNEINSRPFSIVHLATHGQFSSNADETFILTWDKRIKVNELSSLLKSRDETLPDPIELLVLSACQTADGDNRATLGLAGIAVRAGARSTVATLWEVNDKSTTLFMSKLYQKLVEPKLTITKADALQQIQKLFLESSNYKHPYYWTPFVLVGNWLSLFQS